MDFESLKRKLSEKQTGTKWRKRGDAEKERVKAYFEKHASSSKSGVEPLNPVELGLSVSSSSGDGYSPHSSKKDASTPSDMTDDMPKQEVIRRLRDLGEPATLFGETDQDRWRRLRHLQISGPSDLLIEQGGNDFQDEFRRKRQETERREVEEKTDKLSTAAKLQLEEEALKKKITELSELGSKLEANEFEAVEDRIACTLKMLLKAWEVDLDKDRARIVKEDGMSGISSGSGGVGSGGSFNFVKNCKDATMWKQTYTYLDPLLHALAQKTLSGAIVTPLDMISTFMLQREYVKANEWYVKLAIGNAPWPMGVTMVGIHERANREKVECAKVAHILNNETQRKYIQALKRLMTQTQRLFPTDPSKCVW